MLYTVGYGGFSPEEFLHALRSRGVEVLADVRRFPRSKTDFYSGENLREALRRVGVEYVWFGELGALGVRGPGAGCAASKTFDAYVWRLYHYAPALLQLEELEQLARRRTVALMCREEDWRHCHRQFLADFFVKRGFEVIHIRGGARNGTSPRPASTRMTRLPSTWSSAYTPTSAASAAARPYTSSRGR